MAYDLKAYRLLKRFRTAGQPKKTVTERLMFWRD
jgi:hypothetical protein